VLLKETQDKTEVLQAGDVAVLFAACATFFVACTTIHRSVSSLGSFQQLAVPEWELGCRFPNGEKSLVLVLLGWTSHF
jgi:hypothetical protein